MIDQISLSAQYSYLLLVTLYPRLHRLTKYFTDDLDFLVNLFYPISYLTLSNHGVTDPVMLDLVPFEKSNSAMEDLVRAVEGHIFEK